MARRDRAEDDTVEDGAKEASAVWGWSGGQCHMMREKGSRDPLTRDGSRVRGAILNGSGSSEFILLTAATYLLNLDSSRLSIW
jgi:hypothetical protein